MFPVKFVLSSRSLAGCWLSQLGYKNDISIYNQISCVVSIMRGEDVNGNAGPNGYNTVQYYTTYNKTKQLLKICFSFEILLLWKYVSLSIAWNRMHYGVIIILNALNEYVSKTNYTLSLNKIPLIECNSLIFARLLQKNIYWWKQNILISLRTHYIICPTSHKEQGALFGHKIASWNIWNVTNLQKT